MLTTHKLKLLLLFFLLLGAGGFAYFHHWANALIVLGIGLLSWLPSLFARHYAVALPAEFDLATLGFIVAALMLGEMADFYERFWWWDKLLHLTSGLFLGMLGLCLIWVLNYHERIELVSVGAYAYLSRGLESVISSSVKRFVALNRQTLAARKSRRRRGLVSASAKSSNS